MPDWMINILEIIFPSIGFGGLLLLLILFHPEKIEKWSALLWRLISFLEKNVGGIFKGAHKKYIKHDLQGRINDFVKKLKEHAPGISFEKIKIEWIDPNQNRKSFISDGKVVIRLRRDDPQDHNFIHTAYLFVSTCLLKKSKRYLTHPQGEALDLFVCTKLIEKEKPHIISFFLDEYFHPRTDKPKSKVALFIDDFESIDRGGLFFPLFLQELEFLGDKIFGRRRDDQIGLEVNGLINFLKPIVNRTIGDHTDLDFNGQYCKFAIVIIGKPSKLIISIQPYISFIQSHLVVNGIESIYLLCREDNHDKVDSICNYFKSDYNCIKKYKFKSFLKYPDRKVLTLQYIAVLRKIGTTVIQTSSE